MEQLRNSKSHPLKEAFTKVRGGFFGVMLFSFAINMLMLTGPLFMLQIYDRVLSSRSIPTLVVLFGFVLCLYAFYGLFEFLRNRMLSRIGYDIDVQLMPFAQRAWISKGLSEGSVLHRPVADLSSLRRFIGSGGLSAFFDLPWLPIFLLFVFALHPTLGLLALGGVVVVVLIALLNELMTRKPVAEASGLEHHEKQFAEQTIQSSDAIVSMGMISNITELWSSMRHNTMAMAQKGGNRAERFGALSKSTRLVIQSGILALGAYLAILEQITPGAMIAASILSARAIAPVDQAIANWRNFVNARQTYGRLKSALLPKQNSAKKAELPEPQGLLSVSALFKFTKQTGAPEPILKGLDFELNPGDGLGVIGPSAAGKSSLARLIVGLWKPDRGEIRLDGATLDQWDSDELGQHIGYLPQVVNLLPGTVSQNIARFDPQADDKEVIEAAKLAGVHKLILKLPDGYSTKVSVGDTVLSGGQAQRIALARAVFRKPALVVLDEPNANLDQDGDAALTKAIARLRENGSTVIVMAHRPSAIASVNFLLMLKNGKQVEFGPKEETLRKLTRPISSQNPIVISSGNKGKKERKA